MGSTKVIDYVLDCLFLENVNWIAKNDSKKNSNNNTSINAIV